MLNRDFSQSNKNYFAKYKRVLISVVVFLIVGILVASVFGFNGNFEMKGYYEFTVDVKAETNYSKFSLTIKQSVNKYGVNCDTILESGEGDNAQLIIRYSKTLSLENQEFSISSTICKATSG